jgi:hypothetical protein
MTIVHRQMVERNLLAVVGGHRKYLKAEVGLCHMYFPTVRAFGSGARARPRIGFVDKT